MLALQTLMLTALYQPLKVSEEKEVLHVLLTKSNADQCRGAIGRCKRPDAGAGNYCPQAHVQPRLLEHMHLELHAGSWEQHQVNGLFIFDKTNKKLYILFVFNVLYIYH